MKEKTVTVIPVLEETRNHCHAPVAQKACPQSAGQGHQAADGPGCCSWPRWTSPVPQGYESFTAVAGGCGTAG